MGEELGEFIGIRFGRVALGSNEPEWFFLPHTEYDGIGGLAELLRRRGAPDERLPQIKYPAPPSPLSVLKVLPRYLKPRERIEWLPMEKGAGSTLAMPQPPTAVAWRVFDEPTTSQIRRFCRKTGVTVNSFLLRHLTKAIRPFLADQSAVIPWMIPVNLRGKVQLDRDTANHSSYVRVKVKSYETAQDVHRNIYAALGRCDHWANWYAYQSGRFLTPGMQKLLIRKELAIPEWNLGSFSNLGEWDPDRRILSPACRGAWLFCPPVLRFQTIGAGCVTFQQRLTLTIQAHPVLTQSEAVPQAWMANWVKEIEMDVSSLVDEAAAAPWLAA
jgi:hypothetical protein